MNHHAELLEQRDQAVRDLAELDQQVAAGEIDDATAEVLRRRYEADAATALRALRRASGSPDQPPAGTGRPRRGVIVASAIGLVAVGSAVAALPAFIDDRPEGGFVTGNEVTADAPAGRDLDEVTTDEMEAVVAENPDIVPMRLRLAHRYFDAGEFDEAVDHYMAVLDRTPDPEAMSHLGWLVANDGEVEVGVELIERSLALQPDDAEATWFLANLRLYSQRDVEDATRLLEALLERDDLGADRGQVEAALDDARAAAGTQP